jgi:DNA-binding IclR family transcriptional regulator
MSSSDVPALRRGLAVLRLLAGRPGPVSATFIRRVLNLPRSTTYHLLSELTQAGFTVYFPDKMRYGLGIAAFELGSAYLRHDPLDRLARPLLRELADRTGEVAYLGVLHGAEALYLVREQPLQPQAIVSDVGVRMPAHLTASGRAMLAHLPPAEVRALFPSVASFVDWTGRGPHNLPTLRRSLTAGRRQGWAVEDGFVTLGFASVAAPVFDQGERPIAAVTLTFRHVCDTPCEQTWPDLATEVRKTAAELTVRIGGQAADVGISRESQRS